MTRASPAAVTLLGVCYDASSTFERGAGRGPAEVRRGIGWDGSNTWTERGLDLAAPGVLDDAGDLLPEPGPEGRSAIERAVGRILDAGSRPLVVGGDHSVSFPSVRAVRARFPTLAVVHIDAHADLYDEYEGDRYSHASPMARIMEDGLADRMVQLGVRTLNGHQRAQARRLGVEIIEMQHWQTPVALRFQSPVYVTLDLDALDPAFAPGVAHPEPGGFTVRDLLNQLRSIEGTIVGADLVELNPRFDPSPRTALVAAKLVKELVDRMTP